MPESERADLEPVPNFRFAVKIKGTNGQDMTVGWFTECGGLSVERKTYPYSEGGLNAYVHELPDRITRTHITLKRGIADAALWQWFAGENDVGLYEGKVTYRDATIILYNVDRTEAKRWNVDRAYPVKWTGPDLKSGDNLVAVETLELVQGEGVVPDSVQRSLGEGQEGEAGEASQQVPPDQEIDLSALANEVYALLKRESRIERERLGRSRAW